jgi:hypothetical protein
LFLTFDGGFRLRKFTLPQALRQGIFSVFPGTSAEGPAMGGMRWLDDNTLLYYLENRGAGASFDFYALTLSDETTRQVFSVKSGGQQNPEQIENLVPYDEGLAVVTSERMIYYDKLFNFVRERPIPMTQGYYGDLTAWGVSDLSKDGRQLLYTDGGSLYLSGSEFEDPTMIYEGSAGKNASPSAGGTFPSGACFSKDGDYVGFTIIDYEAPVGTGVYSLAKKDLTVYEGGEGFSFLDGVPGKQFLIAGDELNEGVTPMIRDLETGSVEQYAPEWVGSVSWIDSGRLLKTSEGAPAVLSIVEAKNGGELYSFEPFHSAAFPFGPLVAPGQGSVALLSEYANRDDVLLILKLR